MLAGSYGCALSGNRAVIVGSSDSTRGYQVFRWNAAEGMVGLGVSADGVVIFGQSNSANGYEAFRWSAATSNAIQLGGVDGTATGLDAVAQATVLGHGDAWGLIQHLDHTVELLAKPHPILNGWFWPITDGHDRQQSCGHRWLPAASLAGDTTTILPVSITYRADTTE